MEHVLHEIKCPPKTSQDLSTGFTQSLVRLLQFWIWKALFGYTTAVRLVCTHVAI